MNKTNKILLGLGIISVAIGGFALTKYLTRNVVRDRGWTVTFVKYDTPATGEPLED
jgi:hypothetical protein